MNYQVFNNYLNEVVNAIDALHNHLDVGAEKTFLNNGKWALRVLEKFFKDKNRNLRRWLNGKPCVYLNNHINKKFEISIGTDREALYYFLVFCKQIEEKKEISEEFCDYLALIINRSYVAGDNWEEC